MKVTIKYDYKRDINCPYIAKGFNKIGLITLKVSDISFKDAKESLIDRLRQINKLPKPELPKPEEIEI